MHKRPQNRYSCDSGKRSLSTASCRRKRFCAIIGLIKRGDGAAGTVRPYFGRGKFFRCAAAFGRRHLCRRIWAAFGRRHLSCDVWAAFGRRHLCRRIRAAFGRRHLWCGVRAAFGRWHLSCGVRAAFGRRHLWCGFGLLSINALLCAWK